MKIFLFATLLFFVSATPAQAQVVLSEVYPAPTSDEHEWIELYNQSNTPVSITGWKLLEHYANVSELTTFTEIYLEPYSFFVFELATNRLNNAEEEVSLVNESGTTVSSIHYYNSESQKSFSYAFSNTTEMSSTLILNSPTKNARNQSLPTPTPTVAPTSSPNSTNQPATQNSNSNQQNESASVAETTMIKTTTSPDTQDSSQILDSTEQNSDKSKKAVKNEQLALYHKIKAKLTKPSFIPVEKVGLEKRLPQLSYIVQKKVSKEGVISAIIGGSLLLFTGLLL